MIDKKGFSQHISRQFNEELNQILNRVMSMGGLVERQLGDALKALAEGDKELAERVIRGDDEVNAIEVSLDDECTHILARRQPAASDLRLVLSVTKAIIDLERIGDEAERIGRMGLNLTEEQRQLGIMSDVVAMGQRVKHILHGALDAFTRMDAAQAARVAEEDVEIDKQYDQIMQRLIAAMEENRAAVRQTLNIVWAVRSLERIGDRSHNICEQVIYFVKGKDVRHTSFAEMAEEAGINPAGDA